MFLIDCFDVKLNSDYEKTKQQINSGFRYELTCIDI